MYKVTYLGSPTALSPLQNFNVSPCGKGTIFSQIGHGHGGILPLAELPLAQARRKGRFMPAAFYLNAREERI